MHEVCRVFCDRLIDDKDKEWFLDKVKVIVKEQLKDNFDAMMGGLGQGPVTVQSLNSLIYTTVMDQDEPEPSLRFDCFLYSYSTSVVLELLVRVSLKKLTLRI